MTSYTSKHRPYSSGDGQPGSAAWFISFGDLLTLLLCFFLVLTPWGRLGASKQALSSQRFSLQNPPPALDGTTFASDLPLRGSVTILEAPLLANDWGIVAEEAPGFPLEALEAELRSVNFRGATASLLVCDGKVDRAAILREVGDVLRRVSGEEGTVVLEVSGDCENPPLLKPVTEKVVGRIRITKDVA